MSDLRITIKITDVGFSRSPDAGNTNCICSRCYKLIEKDEESIRVWLDVSATEYRFHSKCIQLLRGARRVKDE